MTQGEISSHTSELADEPNDLLLSEAYISASMAGSVWGKVVPAIRILKSGAGAYWPRESSEHTYWQTPNLQFSPFGIGTLGAGVVQVGARNVAVPGAHSVGSFTGFARRYSNVIKVEQQHRERLAAVWLDETAQKLLNVLDRETSIRWENLPHRAESDWSEAARAAALLVGANLCEVSPTRIRLNEYGDRLLAELFSDDPVAAEVEH
jgi:hypothetical protein